MNENLRKELEMNEHEGIVRVYDEDDRLVEEYELTREYFEPWLDVNSSTQEEIIDYIMTSPEKNRVTDIAYDQEGRLVSEITYYRQYPESKSFYFYNGNSVLCLDEDCDMIQGGTTVSVHDLLENGNIGKATLGPIDLIDNDVLENEGRREVPKLVMDKLAEFGIDLKKLDELLRYGLEDEIANKEHDLSEVEEIISDREPEDLNKAVGSLSNEVRTKQDGQTINR